MSNTLSPFGFRLASRADGAQPNYAIQYRQIAYNNTNKFGFGDPVKTLNTGYIDAATAGSTFSGIFLGCEYVDTNFARKVYFPNWSAPSTATQYTVLAKVCMDPKALFVCQIGNDTSVKTQSIIGQNANFGGGGAPNSAGISTAYLDGSTIATTSTLNFRIVGFAGGDNTYLTTGYVGNDPTSANPLVLVALNNCDWNTTTGQ